MKLRLSLRGFSVGIGHLMTFRRYMAAFVVILVLLSPVALWKAFEYRFQLKLLPQELGVWRILSVEKGAWGFGPGGNETGVIVYELPEETAANLASQGLSFFARSRGSNYGWLMTPITEGRLSWTESKRTLISSSYETERLMDFLDQYGFGIPVDPAVQQMTDKAIVTSGNFYAYGRGGGVAIVIPSIRRVVYAYAG